MVGGVGEVLTDTQELHVMKFKEAMKIKSKDKWKEAVMGEYDIVFLIQPNMRIFQRE